MYNQIARRILLCTLIGLFFATTSVHAVSTVKTSDYGAGHQIWFEVEDFDERNPEGDQYYPVVDAADAFGQAVARAGGAGGMIRWTFDISKAGGTGGTWYFWARQINPSNSSDYMLVEGDPGDAEIPAGPPFPGGDGAPFDNADDRVFEIDVGPSWGWAQGWDIEGHAKELQDGENTMYIFHRQGNDTVFWDVFMWTDDPDYVPSDEDYQNATVFVRDKASNPSPASEATDVPRDVGLSWSPGQFANRHDVYFGTVLDDVDTADRANALGVLVSQDQDANSYDPSVKGRLWSFTVEPFAYPVENILATASAAEAGSGPENTVNGSGLDADDLHSIEATDMWLAVGGVDPVWLQYEFDRVYKLHEMLVWNYNVMFELVLGFGLKDVTIEHSLDGVEWTVLVDVEFAQGTAMPDYAANTVVDMGGVAARFVRLTVSDNWGMLTQYGLSEVRFTYIPVHPREPVPGDGETEVNVEAILKWRAGREAAAHEVYFGM
ncbi:MAG: discoidin domain-containing protein, partial [Planctomycetota bacterium]